MYGKLCRQDIQNAFDLLKRQTYIYAVTLMPFLLNRNYSKQQRLIRINLIYLQAILFFRKVSKFCSRISPIIFTLHPISFPLIFRSCDLFKQGTRAPCFLNN